MFVYILCRLWRVFYLFTLNPKYILKYLSLKKIGVTTYHPIKFLINLKAAEKNQIFIFSITIT